MEQCLDPTGARMSPTMPRRRGAVLPRALGLRLRFQAACGPAWRTEEVPRGAARGRTRHAAAGKRRGPREDARRFCATAGSAPFTGLPAKDRHEGTAADAATSTSPSSASTPTSKCRRCSSACGRGTTCPNLAVSDTFTASPTLERHLAGLDYAAKVLDVEVVHGINDLVGFLGPATGRRGRGRRWSRG